MEETAHAKDERWRVIVRSPLSPFASLWHDPDPEKARRLAAAIWREEGVLLLNPSWAKGWAERQEIINLGDRLHGKRRREA